MLDLNIQLQELAARVKHTENAITGIHQSLSQIADALIKTPAAAAGIVAKSFYNYVPYGYQKILDLVGAKGLPNFNSLMMELSDKCMKVAADAVDQVVEDFKSTIAGMIDLAVAEAIAPIVAAIATIEQVIVSLDLAIDDLEHQIKELLPNDPKREKLEKEKGEKEANLVAQKKEKALKEDEKKQTTEQVLESYLSRLSDDNLKSLKDFVGDQKRLSEGKTKSGYFTTTEK